MLGRGKDKPKRSRQDLLKLLEKQAEIGSEPDMTVIETGPDGSGGLFLDASLIHTGVALFQARSLRGNDAAERAVLKGLIQIIKSGREVDPVVVWWSGAAWWCLDGHHRLRAYRKVNQDIRKANEDKRAKALASKSADVVQLKLQAQRRVPVVVHEGNLGTALLWATKLNGKVSMPLSSNEKTDRAWMEIALIFGQVVRLPREFYSGNHINLAALVDELHVGRTTLSKMKGAFLKMSRRLTQQLAQRDLPGYEQENIRYEKAVEWSQMSWREAQRFAEDEDAAAADVDYNHEEAVKEFADRFIRAFGRDILQKKGHVVADAFLGLSREAPEHMMASEEWMEQINRLQSERPDLFNPTLYDDDEVPEGDIGW